MEYPSVKVTVLGPSLLREAVEVLLRTLPQGAGSGTPGAPPPVAFMVGNGHAAPRIRERNVPAQSHVIVLVGPDWQDRVAAERRNQPRGTPAPAPPRPDPRYVLVTNERNADFYGARRLAITAFIGDDEPPEVLAQGIASAAAGRSFCSPQLLPTLIDAVGGAPIATSPPENGAGRPAEMEAAAASSASGSGVDAELSSREHEVTLHAARP